MLWTSDSKPMSTAAVLTASPLPCVPQLSPERPSTWTGGLSRTLPVCGPGDHVLAIGANAGLPAHIHGRAAGPVIRHPPLLMFDFLANPDPWNQWG